MDFNKILDGNYADKRDKVEELRSAFLLQNKLILDYIDESREQSRAFQDRLKLIEEALEIHCKSIDAIEGIVRDI
jgi:hypothetical protein